MWLPAQKNVQANSNTFAAVFCTDFIIFLCVTLKLFSLSFVSLFSPNPGDALPKINSPEYLLVGY